MELTYHKQSDEYHKAMKEKDYVKAYWLHMPPTMISLDIILHRHNMAQLKKNYEAEMERTKNMSKEMLEYEIKHRLL